MTSSVESLTSTEILLHKVRICARNSFWLTLVVEHRIVYPKGLQIQELYMIFPLLFLLSLASVTGYTQPANRLTHEGTVEASVEDVWTVFTTKSGLESWMTSHAEIELKIGGVMKTQYDPSGNVNDATAIHNTVLSYDPLNMLSFQVSKAPEKFPFPTAIKDMWTVVYFEPKGETKTLVRIVCSGFNETTESIKMREFFDRGNGFTLQELQKRFSEKKKE